MQTGLTAKKLEQLRTIPAAAFPNRVKVALDLMEVSQTQVAEDTGINPSTLSQIVNGKHQDPSLPTARTLANYCGCLIEDLFPEREAVA